MKGRYHVAIPRKGMIAYCNPRKDTKGPGLLLFPIKYRTDKLKQEHYDFVYSAGLYDYIKTFPDNHSSGTIALTKNMFDLVKPGGSLVIGNFNQNNPPEVRYIMDYMCDWVLIYRSRQEMLDFARSIPEREIKSMEVLEEPLGINYFLKIDKA
jgi:extracellular factor (EF) 3-hydroxypalmitic acid methyl ester biosynthesis protein